MAEVAHLMAKISADTSGFTSAMNSVEGRLKSVGSAMGTGLAVGAAVGVAAIAALGAASVAYGKDATALASSLAETISKTNVVLGSAAKGVIDWSQTSVDSLAMTQQQALDAASTFAIFGNSAGISGTELGRFSTDLVGLAADMASFSDTTSDEAIVAIGAALRGESEPIRRYGVLLDDATMRQKALEMGIISTTKQALTPQQRVLAATAMIFEQTAMAQGDLERTGGGFAGMQKKLSSSLVQLQTDIGTTLLPAMTELTTAAYDMVMQVGPTIVDFIGTYVAPALTSFADGVAVFADKLNTALSNIVEGANPVAAFVDAFDLSPIATQMNDMITGVENWVNQQIVAFDNIKWDLNELAIAYTVNMNKIIEAVNAVANAGNAFFNSFGAKMAQVTGNAFVATPDIVVQALKEVPMSLVQTPSAPIALNRIPTGIPQGPMADPNSPGWGGKAGWQAIKEDTDKASAAAGNYQAKLGGLAGTGGSALKAVDDKFKSILGSVQSLISKSMDLGVTWTGMKGGGGAGGGDAINENAKRLAAIANEGLIGQPWLEEFKAEVPGAWADLKLLMAEGMSAESAAQSMLGQFQAGDYMALLDKGMIKDQVKAMIMGDQGASALAQEIAGELATELGVSMPEALAAAQSAMGVKGGGATDSTTGGFVEGVDGDAAATGALAKIAKSFLDNEKQVRASGANVGGWWGEGFMATVGDNVPIGLLDMLVAKLLPAMLAAFAARKTTTEPAT